MTDKKLIKNKIGQRIKSLRQQQGVSIEKLAYGSDLAKGNLSEIEKGMIDPKLSTLQKVADGFGITLSELFDF